MRTEEAHQRFPRKVERFALWIASVQMPYKRTAWTTRTFHHKWDVTGIESGRSRYQRTEYDVFDKPVSKLTVARFVIVLNKHAVLPGNRGNCLRGAVVPSLSLGPDKRAKGPVGLIASEFDPTGIDPVLRAKLSFQRMSLWKTI
jgi:hypothetical protein